MRYKKEDLRSTCEYIDIPAYSSTCHLTLNVPGVIHSYCQGEQRSKTEKQSSKTEKQSSKINNVLIHLRNVLNQRAYQYLLCIIQNILL